MSFTLHIASTLYLPNSLWFLQKYVKLDQKSWKSAQTSRRVNPTAASFHALNLLPQLNSARSSRQHIFCRVEQAKQSRCKRWVEFDKWNCNSHFIACYSTYLYHRAKKSHFPHFSAWLVQRSFRYHPSVTKSSFTFGIVLNLPSEIFWSEKWQSIAETLGNVLHTFKIKLVHKVYIKCAQGGKPMSILLSFHYRPH